jgi:predicted Co/Zn/Cd cation transporter (cation efflux family)
MQGINFLAIVVAAVAAFVASAVWYTAFANPMANLSDSAESGTPVWTMLFVIAQSLVVAFMIAYVASHLGIASLSGAVGLGALLWVFPAAILLGSVVHEGVPLALASIHAGDWLAKLILITTIVSIWR